MGPVNEIERREGAVGPADDPPRLLRSEAVVVGEDALDPYADIGSIHAELADGLAGEVRRGGDTAGGVDEHAGVAEVTRREHRDRDERRVVRSRERRVRKEGRSAGGRNDVEQE